MKKLLLLWLGMLFIPQLLFPQQVTNITANQRTDGSKLLDVYFDLAGPDPAYDIMLEVSFDAGANYQAVNEVTGDNSNIEPGTNLHLVWDAGQEFPDGFYTETFRARVTATVNSWQCGDEIEDIDGNIYNTTLIGEQCWMAENLNTTQGAAGNNITRYCYDDDPVRCEQYGGLYDWNTVMNGEESSNSNPSGVQGICPEGWHVPSDEEWTQLVDYVVSQGYPNDHNDPNGAGNALKSCRQVNSPLGGDCNTSEHPRWDEHNMHHGLDAFGFIVFPGGYRYTDGYFYTLGYDGIFWSSMETSSTSAWGRDMYGSLGDVYHDDSNKGNGFSVRCLKDDLALNLPPTQPANPIPEDGATNQSINTELQWACSDPEQDPLTYDVYFGTANPPVELVSTAQADTFYTSATLDYDTQYFWIIITHDDQGNTTEGPVWSFTTEEEPAGFTCGVSTITDIDGNVYNTTLIGDQCWMAENLNTTRDATGNDITRYCYDNDPERCEQYGGLYDWNTMMNGEESSNSNPSGVQGICPEGWHVPSDAEWTQLVDYVVSQGYPNSSSDPNGAGNALKSCRQINSPLGSECSTSEHPR